MLIELKKNEDQEGEVPSPEDPAFLHKAKTRVESLNNQPIEFSLKPP